MSCICDVRNGVIKKSKNVVGKGLWRILIKRRRVGLTC